MALHTSISNLCEALDNVAETVENTLTDDRTLHEIHGWNTPALDRFDLAGIAYSISNRLRESGDNFIPDETRTNQLNELANQVTRLKTNTIPQLTASAVQAAPAYINTMFGIELSLLDILNRPNWQLIEDPDLMPNNIAKRVRSTNARLNQIEPDIENLEQIIGLIKGARDAAESLPTDLESLQEARNEIASIKKSATTEKQEITTIHGEANTAIEAMRGFENEAQGLIKQLKELHRIGTSTTLAGAFHARAESLSKSVLLWLGVLAVSLTIAVLLGSTRVNEISKAMTSAGVNWEGVWINVILTIFSVSAPIWLAWVATKQIVQRFKLSEDYAYKASISNAYEGYRREAVDLDAGFRNKLFGSALTRLDEVPGRLIDNDVSGSPLHEIISSPIIREAINIVPNFSDKLIDFAKAALATTPSKAEGKIEKVPSADGENSEATAEREDK